MLPEVLPITRDGAETEINETVNKSQQQDVLCPPEIISHDPNRVSTSVKDTNTQVIYINAQDKVNTTQVNDTNTPDKDANVQVKDIDAGETIVAPFECSWATAGGSRDLSSTVTAAGELIFVQPSTWYSGGPDSAG